jgi:hypothetical protein
MDAQVNMNLLSSIKDKAAEDTNFLSNPMREENFSQSDNKLHNQTISTHDNSFNSPTLK